MDRRTFLGGIAAAGALGALQVAQASPVAKIGSAAKKNRPSGKFDDNLVIFISDLHCNPDGYQPGKLSKVASDILALRPLPRNVIALGDLAFLTGRPAEYAAVKSALALLEEAGITLTLAMGNHDRRAEFGEAFPAQAAKSLFKDRYVYIVETPNADFIVLDSLQESESNTTYITPGKLNEGQTGWLKNTLDSYTKPVFVCAHHTIEEIGLVRIISESPTCCGYIYGHRHRWLKDWTEVWSKGSRVVRTLCMPSTGHWGDIGFVALQLGPESAVATLHVDDFFFPEPARNPADRPAQWSVFPEELNGDTCTFALK